jgi:hypothetical protein
MMFHIDEFIKAIDGVIDIMPDRNVVKNGKYRVQVSHEKFKQARVFLLTHLQSWCQEYIPDDAYPHPNPFPESPRVQPIHNDGFSSGENSWMSHSNTSFMSMDLSNVADDDYFTNTTAATKAFTYAEIVLPQNAMHHLVNHDATAQPTYPIGQNDDETRAAISDITTTAKTENDKTQQELEKAKELIEKQRREIQELRDEQQKSIKSYGKRHDTLERTFIGTRNRSISNETRNFNNDTTTTTDPFKRNARNVQSDDATNGQHA